MSGKLIVVAGHLAAGKTTFAQRLSRELSVPIFSKDLLKIALSASLPVRDREDSKRLSAATFDAMAFIAERCLEAGRSAILEANFAMGENHGGVREAEALRAIVERHGAESLTFVFQGDLRVLYERFTARDQLPERGDANRMTVPFPYEDFAAVSRPLGEFAMGGERVVIDTTDFAAVDGEHLVGVATRFLIK